jgi:2-(1,2-epoxy-1,2-dihydrophenyl)acetyl-CoA isomerase
VSAANENNSNILENIEDGLAVITLNRPERMNALSPDMIATLLHILPRLARDPAVRCVALTGAGRAFCAGGDVKAMDAKSGDSKTGDAKSGDVPAPAAERSLEEAAHGLRQHMEISAWLHEMPKPTIALLNGAAVGSGLSIALACDLRYAVTGVKLITAFSRFGYSDDYGGVYFMTKMIGTARTRELYFLSETILSERACEMGLVNGVFPAETFAEEGMKIAKRLGRGAPIGQHYIKRDCNLAETQDLKTCLDFEAIHHVRGARSEDHRNATRAAAEKREPVFTGR